MRPSRHGTRIDLDAARGARAPRWRAKGSGNARLLPLPDAAGPGAQDQGADRHREVVEARCKDAYKGLGLLAVVPLIANEFGEGNCRS